MTKKYQKILSQSLQHDIEDITLDRLHGEASNRIYYRATLQASWKGQSTYIIMQLPEGALSASEEITNFKGTMTELPFLNIQSFLEKNAIPVPHVIDFVAAERCLILEDLGDITMESVVSSADTATQTAWYQKAIDLLIEWQALPIGKPDDCYALKRSFDETLFNWEFDHFFEYGIEKRLHKIIQPADKKTLDEWRRGLSQQLAQLQTTLVHRDFQSRNLMVVGDQLKIIDFQDALLGPSVYDLVALLRDSYVELDPALLKNLLAYYCEKSEIENLTAFMKIFDIMTVQRKLKDAGRFVYIDQVKGNPHFLKSLPVSLRYVQSALERQTELAPFYTILKKYVPEWSPKSS
jgi:N-acetylmuramate 1-kinase